MAKQLGKLSQPRGAVAVFHSKRDSTPVFVYAKKGESKQSAIKRVADKHNVVKEDVRIF